MALLSDTKVCCYANTHVHCENILSPIFQSTKIFVGSLGNGARPGDLRRLFEKFGSVVECDIVNRCGFVHMQTEDQAKDAIRKLNKSAFNGQTISVEWGRPKDTSKEDRPARSRGNGGANRRFSPQRRRRSPYSSLGQRDRIGSKRDDENKRRRSDERDRDRRDSSYRDKSRSDARRRDSDRRTDGRRRDRSRSDHTHSRRDSPRRRR